MNHTQISNFKHQTSDFKFQPSTKHQTLSNKYLVFGVWSLNFNDEVRQYDAGEGSK